MHSVMQHQFAQVPRADIPRSSFNRSHGYKTTFDSGYLVPIFCDEVLPGDTYNLRLNLFARLATPITPFMDNLTLTTFFFFVPNRLLWDNWQRFNGEQPNPGDSTDFLVPQLTAPAGGFEIGSLADYFGLPTGIPGIKVNALPFRAYNLIHNEWYRDQNLQNSAPVATTDAAEPLSNYKLLRRGKRHDYFTSALPWPQKGPGVELPLGGQAVVMTGTNVNYINVAGSQATPATTTMFRQGNAANALYSAGGSGIFDVPSGYYADLTSATSATINSLREAFQLQKLLERDARSGTRYTEIIRSHFGVVSPDARLQRPEYLGGGSIPVSINPVMQTSSSDSTTPQGNLAAFGVASGSGTGFSRSFTEHGILIGLIHVGADLTYQQGIDRMFSRQTRWDYYWPAFQHLGEQEILNKEIYAQGNDHDDEVFGYQERYAEYRYFPSKITGKFRSTYAQTLDFWHLSQKFDSLPMLNEEFIVDKPPIKRVIAVQDEPEFLLDTYFRLICARPMSVYSVPGLIDHF